jgi:uncharacterized protein involved in exopolysaccharide biosynthesis
MDEQREQQKPLFESMISFFIKVKPYVEKLWSCRKQMLLVNGSVCVLALLVLFLFVRPYYQSTITILPDFGNKTSDMISQFSGLASLAGVNVGDNPPTQIYQNLILSETVVSDVIYKRYQTQEYDHPVNLMQYFDLKPDKSLPANLQERKMFLKMYEDMSKFRTGVNYDRMTKILVVTVEMPESKLSADVVNELVLSMDRYVRTQRKSYATEQRKYLEERVKQIKDTLTFCEDRLKVFRETNRQTLQSPELQLEQARLMRNVEIQQAIYSELIKQLELVKLSEVKDTPVVNVREYAQEPVMKTGPKRVMILIGILFFSLLLSATWFLMREKILSGWTRIRKNESN